MMAWRTGDSEKVRSEREKELVAGGRTGEDPHVNGGECMLPSFPACYWGFPHLIPRDKITLRTAD